MKTPLFDVAGELAPLRAEIDAAIARVLDSGVFVGGEEVTSFENELAAYARAGHVVGTSSGTDALHSIGMALEISPGDEVVTTPFTFFATAGSFARLGATIRFADIDEETLTLSPRAALEACSPRTRLIVVVNLFGRPAELPCDAPCAIIEDAAQSIGSSPPRGLASALSFFPTKNMGAIGDAGAVVTDDAAFADRLRLLREHGARPKFRHVAIGGNFRLDALQAAVLRVKLRHLDATTRGRRARADRYRAAFAGEALDKIRVPPGHPDHVYHHFVIRAEQRDELRAHLAACGIETGVYYPAPLDAQPCFGAMRSLPNARRACTEVLALPLHARVDVDRVVATVADFYRDALMFRGARATLLPGPR